MNTKTTLQKLNESKPFGLWVLNDKGFKYYISHRTTGDIKGAGASKQTLSNNCDSECWQDYEILTRLQYKKKWGI